MRIDPPPSPPVASVMSPPATAAAEPPDDPPAVRPSCHGLCVTPRSRLTLMLSPPNSLPAVWPTGPAPPRSTTRPPATAVYVPLRSPNTPHPHLPPPPYP